MSTENLIIIIGATGFVGGDMFKQLKDKGENVIGTSFSAKNSQFQTLNLTDSKSIEEFASKIQSVKHLVITAGKEPQQSLRDLTLEHLSSMIAIHYSGPLWLIKCLQDKFTNQSSITLVSSVAANKGSYDPTYSSLKGAVNSMVRTLARELAPFVRVNAIAPGLIEGSPVFEGMTSDFRDKHRNTSLTKTFLKPDELTRMLFEIQDQLNLNGQIIHINGGQYFG